MTIMIYLFLAVINAQNPLPRALFPVTIALGLMVTSGMMVHLFLVIQSVRLKSMLLLKDQVGTVIMLAVTIERMALTLAAILDVDESKSLAPKRFNFATHRKSASDIRY